MKKWLMAAALAAAGLTAADARAQTSPYNPAPVYVPAQATVAAPAPTPAAAPTYVQGSGACPNGDCGPQGVPAPAYGGYATYGGPPAHGNKFYSGKHWTKGGLLSLIGGSNVAQMPTLPVYMAAPWYLYWPYDGHFQTVAPMAHGLYYPPPTYTGNPYQPGVYPGYVAGSPVPAFPVAPVRP
jgi:hypothetical protein